MFIRSFYLSDFSLITGINCWNRSSTEAAGKMWPWCHDVHIRPVLHRRKRKWATIKSKLQRPSFQGFSFKCAGKLLYRLLWFSLSPHVIGYWKTLVSHTHSHTHHLSNTIWLACTRTCTCTGAHTFHFKHYFLDAQTHQHRPPLWQPLSVNTRTPLLLCIT